MNRIRLMAAALVLGGVVAGAAGVFALTHAPQARAGAEATHRHADSDAVARGRCLVRAMGCNDCHTPGYPERNGDVPESEWLTGNTLGWRGAWGTTYPPNLRLSLTAMSEDEWVRYAHTFETRPPMPWFNLRDLGDDDLRAIHRFVVSLGPKGERAPAYVPPTETPTGPYVQFPAPPAP